MIEAQGVTKQYDGHKALDNVNLSVPKGSIYGLLGPNGAGKTSFIRILNQITGPDTGSILLDGVPLQPGDIARIGYLPEERGLYKKMKVGEQLLYLAGLKGLAPNEAKARAMGWFERFEITDWWNKKVEELSKGMAQKVQFISTVIHQPELLIFDEPFSGFDPINTELIKNEIRRLNEEGATVIFSTHRMESVEEICNHIGLINSGKVVIEGDLLKIRSAHKSNTYRIITEHPIAQEQLSSCEVKEFTEQHMGFEYVLRCSEAPAELVTQLLNSGELKHYEEVLPSVNDIFIQLVQNSNE